MRLDTKIILFFEFLFVGIIVSGIIILALLLPSHIGIDTPEAVIPTSYTYPNPVITPGDIFSNATSGEVCVPGYTKTVRNVSVNTKKKVYALYALSYPQERGEYEVDHFIPLALGGSNDIKNLWPEPADPRPGFHEKDIVEVYLHDQVCKSNMSLKDAQDAIRTNWYQVYLSIPNKKEYTFGSANE